MVFQKLYLSAFAGLGCITNELKMPRAHSSHFLLRLLGAGSLLCGSSLPRTQAGWISHFSGYPSSWLRTWSRRPGLRRLGGAQLRRLTPEVGSVSARKELITPDDISCHRRSLNKWVTLDQAPGTFGRISTSHPHSVTAWRCFFPSWGHILANCFCLIGWHKTCVQYPVFLVMLPLLCLDAFSARTHYLILIEGWKKEVRKQEPSLFLPPKAHLYPHLTFYRSVCPAGKGLVPEGWWFPESSLK